MKKTNGKKLKLLKGEKLMYVILVLLVVLIPISNVFTQALLSETNINVEKMEAKIKKQKASNESLTMQIDELVSLENIQKVADNYGLSYNSDNITNVTEN
jgi:cell division protein FtsL